MDPMVALLPGGGGDALTNPISGMILIDPAQSEESMRATLGHEVMHLRFPYLGKAKHLFEPRYKDASATCGAIFKEPIDQYLKDHECDCP